MRWSYTFLIVTIIILAAVILWICHQYLWSELEVHGIIVIPATAPDKAVLLEDQYQFLGEAVGIDNFFGFFLARIFPQPIVALGDGDVNSHAIAVGTLTIGSPDLTPVE